MGTKAFEEMHLWVLEATYQVVMLRPYFANVGKAANGDLRQAAADRCHPGSEVGSLTLAGASD